MKGEGNSLNYTFRMHDPRVGRFLSLDPLAPQYPHNSPFAFAENRVIDGIELEGLEYLNTNESRIFIMFGKTKLNIENCNNPTKNLFKEGGLQTYPDTGQVVDYGYSGRSYTGLLESDDLSSNLNKGKSSSSIDRPKTEFYELKNSNGHLRVKLKTLSEKTITLGGGNNAKGNAIVAAIDGINWGLSKYINTLIKEDYELMDEHQSIYIKYVMPAINNALNSKKNYIEEKYRNDFSLSIIANAILYGEKYEGYEELFDIGIRIYNDIAIKPHLISDKKLKDITEKQLKESLEIKKDNIQTAKN